MKYIVTVLGALCALLSFSQEIQLGQPLPDMQWTVAQTGKQLRSSDLKGKTVIIDFWSTRCLSCLQSFRKVDSIQKRLKEKLQVVLVTNETGGYVRSFFEKRKAILKWPQVPVVTDAEQLKNLFPHEGLPYLIWIDQQGIVRQKTDGNYFTEKHIKGFQLDPLVQLPQRVTRKYTSPFEEWAADAGNRMRYYSCITNCKKEIHIGFAQGAGLGDSLLRVSANCSPAIGLFRTAFLEGGKRRLPTTAHIVLEVKNRYRFTMPVDPDSLEDWQKLHSYNYELVLPQSQGGKMYTYMQQDLMRFFGVDAKIEKRKITCLVLVRTSQNDRLKTKGGEPLQKLKVSSIKKPLNDSVRVNRNRPFTDFARLLSRLVEYHLDRPFVDATGYTGNVDIRIDWKVLDNFDLQAWKKELSKYDLDIVEKEEWVEVLCISE